MADRAVLMPGARRLDARCLEFTAEDMRMAYQAFRALVLMSRS